jgi:hypothetical protein
MNLVFIREQGDKFGRLNPGQRTSYNTRDRMGSSGLNKDAGYDPLQKPMV